MVVFYTFVFICPYLFLIYDLYWCKHFCKIFNIQLKYTKNVHFYIVWSKIYHILIPLIWYIFQFARVCIKVWFRLFRMLIKFAYKKQTLLDYLMWYAWEDFVFRSPQSKFSISKMINGKHWLQWIKHTYVANVWRK